MFLLSLIRIQHVISRRNPMTYTGRCYCGEVAFEFKGSIHSQILCHCRECRYLSGGEPNASIIISEDTFKVTKGELATFARDDLDEPRIRFFCANCGTHICVKSPPRPGMLVVKVGTLDEHSWFNPQVAIYCIDKQPFHQIPESVSAFEKTPP